MPFGYGASVAPITVTKGGIISGAAASRFRFPPMLPGDQVDQMTLRFASAAIDPDGGTVISLQVSVYAHDNQPADSDAALEAGEKIVDNALVPFEYHYIGPPAVTSDAVLFLHATLPLFLAATGRRRYLTIRLEMTNNVDVTGSLWVKIFRPVPDGPGVPIPE